MSRRAAPMRCLTLLMALGIALAGCTEEAAPAPAPAAPEDEEEAATETIVEEVQSSLPIDWNGSTKEGAWVCDGQDGTGACQAGQQVQPDGEFTTSVTYHHNVTAIGLILRWEPADASQTGLVMALYANTGQGLVLLDSVQGTSPLRIDVLEPDIPADGSVTISVWPEGKSPTEPSVFVDATRQPFRVIGHIDTVHAVTTEVPA